MCSKNARRLLSVLLLLALLLSTAVLPAFAEGTGKEGNAYIPTSKDTKPAPEEAEFAPQDLSAYTLLKETGAVRFYWREDRDIIAIEHKRTGYIMKTGVDLPFSDDAKDLVKALKKDDSLSVEEILEKYEPYAADLNTTYTGIANSLVTIEYIDSDKTKYISSASQENAASELSVFSDAEYQLHIQFTKPDISLNVYITLDEDSISYRIPSDEFGGADLLKLSAVDITPFLGASGGRLNMLDEEANWEKVDCYRIPGYVFIPDGSGALIRFVDNTSVFNP